MSCEHLFVLVLGMKPLVVTVASPEMFYNLSLLTSAGQVFQAEAQYPDRDPRHDHIQLMGGDNDYPYANVTHKLNDARQIALLCGYDVMMTVESDNVVPQDAFEKLNAVDADVVYGLYVLRHHNAWNTTLEMTFKPAPRLRLLSERYPERIPEVWGKVIPCVGHGFGCTLIRRRVLEAFPFRTEKPRNFAADWYLSVDCQEAGFTQAAHLGVVCGHIWYQGTVIVWPHPEPPFFREQKVVREESSGATEAS